MNQKYIGQLFVEKKYITNEQLAEAIKKQESDNKLLGEILIEMEYVTSKQVVDCLNIQIQDYNNMIDSIMKNDQIEKANILIDYVFYENNKPELIFRTKKSWNRVRLSTKIVIIDIQHVWLIMLSHYSQMLFKTFDRNTKINEINKVLDLLIAYTDEHFSVEEALLKILNTEKNHYDQHKDFLRFLKQKIERANELITEGNRDANTLLNEICEYLNNWILSHIAIHDTNYSIKLMQSKEKDRIIKTWIEYIKKNNIAIITKRQKEFYDNIIK
jgi:hemerythrin-like metal-binding protein